MQIRYKALFICFALLVVILQNRLGATDRPFENEFFPTESINGAWGYAPASVGVRQSVGQTIGSSRSYTTVEGLVFMRTPLDQPAPVFLDLRLHRFDDDTYGCNEGIGFRYALDERLDIFGINFYHDYQNDKHNHFNQIGLGLEYLLPCGGVRLNGYLPIGRKQGKYGSPCIFDEYEGGYVAIKQVMEGSLAGIDLEIEKVLVNCSCHQMRIFVAGGPYCYFPRGCLDKLVWGGDLGLYANLKGWLNISVSASNDNVFGTRVQGQIGIYIPFTFASACDCGCYSSAIYQPVRRMETIVRDRFCEWQWNW